MTEANAPGPWSGAGDLLQALLARAPGVREDAELLRNHLLDRAPERRAEINLLVAAVREGIPARIAHAPVNESPDALVSELASRLAREQGLAPDRAEWAVRTWLRALGRASSPAVPAAPARPARRPSAGPLLAIAIAAIVAGGLAVRWLRTPAYTPERLSFFYSDRPLADDVDELQDYNAWCDAGATLRMTGSPPYECAIVIPFETSVPRIKIDLRVSVAGEVEAFPFTCQLADDSGRVIATASSAGDSASLPARPGRQARFLTAFERPATGWPVGRHRATCESGGQSIQAWLDVK